MEKLIGNVPEVLEICNFPV